MKNIFSKKSLAFFITVLMVFSSIAVIASADTTELDVWDGTIATGYTGDGDGSEGNPYIISTPEQLALMVTTSGGDTYKKYYKLANDIYINDITNPNWQEENPKNWFNINNDNFFRGIFDGCGYTIYGLYYNGNKKDGALFWGIRGDVVTIKNLVISNACIKVTGDTTDTGNNASAIAGAIYQNTTATFENCYIDETVSITGRHGVAGFVGGGTCKSISFANCASFASIYTTVSGGRLGSFVGNLTYNNNTGDARKITYNNCIGSEIYTNYAQYPTYTASYCAVEGSKDTGNTGAAPVKVALEDMKGEAAKTNMPGLDWTGTWATTDGFPVFKSMLPEAPACDHTNQKDANVVEPTYFKDGSKDVVCECGETVETGVVIPAAEKAFESYAADYDADKNELTIAWTYTNELMTDLLGQTLKFNYELGTANGSVPVTVNGASATVTIKGFNAARLEEVFKYNLSVEIEGVDTAKLANASEAEYSFEADLTTGKLGTLLGAIEEAADTVISGTAADTAKDFAQNTVKLDVKEATAVIRFVATEELVNTLKAKTEAGAANRKVSLIVTVGDYKLNALEMAKLYQATTIQISGLSFEQMCGQIKVQLAFDYDGEDYDFVTDEILFACGDVVNATEGELAAALKAFAA